MRNCHLKKSKQTSVKNDSYKSPTKFLQNCRRLSKANNRRHAARLCLGGYAPVSPSARKQPPRERLLPASEVIQRVEITESLVKRAFRGVCPHPFAGITQISYCRSIFIIRYASRQNIVRGFCFATSAWLAMNARLFSTSSSNVTGSKSLTSTPALSIRERRAISGQ